jgi:MmyB-like transcription regulator ligand binding domain
VLRNEAGRNPLDRDLSDLVGELSTRSDEFRTRWARHDVRYHDTGTKRLHHPLVGLLELTYEGMALIADRELTMFVFTAEVGSKSEEALNLLASWSATPDPVTPDADHGELPRHGRRT